VSTTPAMNQDALTPSAKTAVSGAAHGWAAGQIWKTEHGYLMRVESVRSDGMAMIAMIEPYKTKAHTQKPIPAGWVKQPNDKLTDGGHKTHE
jgi:hypothetical protein